MSYDNYLEQQTRKYLDGTEDELSNCCNAFFEEESDLCSECQEHAISIADDRYNAMEDKADEQRELAK